MGIDGPKGELVGWWHRCVCAENGRPFLDSIVFFLLFLFYHCMWHSLPRGFLLFHFYSFVCLFVCIRINSVCNIFFMISFLFLMHSFFFRFSFRFSFTFSSATCTLPWQQGEKGDKVRSKQIGIVRLVLIMLLFIIHFSLLYRETVALTFLVLPRYCC